MDGHRFPVGSDVGLAAATGELAIHAVDTPTGLGYGLAERPDTNSTVGRLMEMEMDGSMSVRVQLPPHTTVTPP